MKSRKSIYSIESNQIRFYEYPFVHSSANKGPLHFNNIYGIYLNTYPVSLITNSREVIFFNHDSSEEIKALAESSKLNISDRLDIWEIITRPFLDTVTQVSDNEYSTLSSYGIGRSEIDEIRKIVGPYIGMTMEWNYLGQWDVLMARQNRWGILGNILSKGRVERFYWWTMDIATRGLNI